MEFKLENGTILSDDQLETMAEEYENGAWKGCGEVTLGRPRLYDEDMETVSFRIPHSYIAAIDDASCKRGITKSEFYRQAIENELASLS